MIFRSFIFRAYVRHPSPSSSSSSSPPPSPPPLKRLFERAPVNDFNFHGSFEYQLKKISRMSRLARSHIAHGAGPFATAVSGNIMIMLCGIQNVYLYTVTYYLFVNWSVYYIDTRVSRTYTYTYLPKRKHGCGERKLAAVTGRVEKINKIPTVNIRISYNMT